MCRCGQVLYSEHGGLWREDRLHPPPVCTCVVERSCTSLDLGSSGDVQMWARAVFVAVVAAVGGPLAPTTGLYMHVPVLTEVAGRKWVQLSNVIEVAWQPSLHACARIRP